MGDDTRDTLTPEALAEIERRAKQATPGPWRVEQDWTWEVTAEEGGIVAKVPQGSPWPNGGLDARFIAAARSDVPLLCASLRAAWAERDEAWEEVEDVVAEAREIKDAQDALLAERGGERERMGGMAKKKREYNKQRDVAEGLAIFQRYGGCEVAALHDAIYASQPDGVALSAEDIARLAELNWIRMEEYCSCTAEETDAEGNLIHEPTCTGWGIFV
jgi:hypothetical protein